MAKIFEKPEGFISAEIRYSGTRATLVMECEDSIETEIVGKDYQNFDIEISENELILTEV